MCDVPCGQTRGDGAAIVGASAAGIRVHELSQEGPRPALLQLVSPGLRAERGVSIRFCRTSRELPGAAWSHRARKHDGLQPLPRAIELHTMSLADGADATSIIAHRQHYTARSTCRRIHHHARHRGENGWRSVPHLPHAESLSKLPHGAGSIGDGWPGAWPTPCELDGPRALWPRERGPSRYWKLRGLSRPRGRDQLY